MNGICPHCLARPSVTRVAITPSRHVFVFYSCPDCQFNVDYPLCRTVCFCAADTYREN